MMRRIFRQNVEIRLKMFAPQAILLYNVRDMILAE